MNLLVFLSPLCLALDDEKKKRNLWILLKKITAELEEGGEKKNWEAENPGDSPKREIMFFCLFHFASLSLNEVKTEKKINILSLLLLRIKPLIIK